MITEAALVTVSCVLFIQLGLSGAIQELVQVKLRIASCPKCLTFWSCLATLLVHGHGLLESVAASFISSYLALWLCLLYDMLALLYNYIYEQITQTNDTREAPEEADSASGIQADSHEVS